MGRPGIPYYGEDLGSAIENVEKIIAKIKTNKFDKQDLIELADAIVAVKSYIEEDEN